MHTCPWAICALTSCPPADTPVKPVEPQSTPKAEDHLGSGYRLLRTGEQLKEGDEFFAVYNIPPVWRRVSANYVGLTMSPVFLPLRRKLRVPEGVPPAGYRFLIEGAVVQSGDVLWFSPGSRFVSGVAQAYADRKHVVGTYNIDLIDFPFVRAVSQHPTAEPKLAPGEGYRLLEAGEVILSTDERLFYGRWQQRDSASTGSASAGEPFVPEGHYPTRRKLNSTTEELRKAKDQVTSLAIKLCKAHCESDRLRDALKDSQASLRSACDALRKAQEQLETQRKNASGNAVLVRADGFSKPITAALRREIGGWVLPSVIKTAEGGGELKGFGGYFSLTRATPTHKEVSYVLQSGKDGFGRAIYREAL